MKFSPPIDIRRRTSALYSALFIEMVVISSGRRQRSGWDETKKYRNESRDLT